MVLLVIVLGFGAFLTFGIIMAGLRAASGADDRLGLDLEPAYHPALPEPARKPAPAEPSPVQA